MFFGGGFTFYIWNVCPHSLTLIMTLDAKYCQHVCDCYLILSNFILEKATVSGEGMDIKGLLDVTTEMWRTHINKSCIGTFISHQVFSLRC